MACDGAAMRRQLADHAFDVVVLDLMLPGDDGLSAVPLGARSESDDADPHADRALPSAPTACMGLELGADDYMAKPFEPRELVARHPDHSAPRGAR